jgi:hypothetical protein
MGGEEANGSAPKKAKLAGGHEGHSTVVILDYGSQYSQLITRRVREIGVFSVMLPGDADMVREREQREQEEKSTPSPSLLLRRTRARSTTRPAPTRAPHGGRVPCARSLLRRAPVRGVLSRHDPLTF